MRILPAKEAFDERFDRFVSDIIQQTVLHEQETAGLRSELRKKCSENEELMVEIQVSCLPLAEEKSKLGTRATAGSRRTEWLPWRCMEIARERNKVSAEL